MATKEQKRIRDKWVKKEQEKKGNSENPVDPDERKPLIVNTGIGPGEYKNVEAGGDADAASS